MTAVGLVGRVEDIADAVGLLASADAGWITGQHIEASGGSGLIPPALGAN
jgi:3-oxoacyl-[acyl-carrier protein] reductase